jgi:histidinol-phosphate aminotransferase
VRGLHAYVPGEQPRGGRVVKLNTNENPYPPSPKVLAAVSAAVDGRLRLYPDPVCQRLRERLARLHGCAPGNVLVGNGSDDLLALAIRAFVEPAASVPASRRDAATVQYLVPSYSLYPVLAETHGARPGPVPLAEAFALPAGAALRRAGWRPRAALSLVTTPNAPSGRGYATAELDRLCRGTRGVVLLDEAYVDFAREHALPLALAHPHVLVARTFSKAYSLCFQRVGYVVGHPVLIDALRRVQDSYPVNGLGQVAALATLGDLGYYRANLRRIRAARARLTRELEALGFVVLPSEANFVLAEPPGPPAAAWLEALRDRRILVRWFAYPALARYLRISVGTEQEIGALVAAAASVLRRGR